MNRRPVPEVRASVFCVTPSPLRVSRISFPMSCGVYLMTCIPSSKVTVREYFSCFGVTINKILPYGNNLLDSGSEHRNVPAREQDHCHSIILKSEVATSNLRRTSTKPFLGCGPTKDARYERIFIANQFDLKVVDGKIPVPDLRRPRPDFACSPGSKTTQNGADMGVSFTAKSGLCTPC
jgi:hypothetical protein